MAGKGGYQRPNNPAMVSGPGALSQRTDGGPSMDAKQAQRYMSGGGEYGASKELNAASGAAPLAGSSIDTNPTPPPVSSFDNIPIPPNITSLLDPTQRPDEPITAGIPDGEGPGPEVLSGMPTLINNRDTEADLVARTIRDAYRQFPSPALYAMVQRLEAEGR